MWGSRFVGARAVGPWVGEQMPLGKTPLGGNPSPEMTYLPTCSRMPACSGDRVLRWSYGCGHHGLNGPRGYLVQRVGVFFVLHCAENVWWQAWAIGGTDHWAANKIRGLVVFQRSSVLLLPWCGGNVPPGGANTPAGVAGRRLPTRGGIVWGIPPPPEACNILSSVRHSK